ncbi:MAG: CTP synthase [Rickettsiales bacterium]|jgi:CTP synthase|nr:CTP synthase [Rickettsiales bacterium]
MTKYIFITGGVVSSLGKGIASATIGALLQSRGFTVKLRKMDPYLNIDPGTMNPTEHGEVFITDDGMETDMDLGHYERFTGNNGTVADNITTGKIYDIILKKERRGDFLGKTLQIIPHVTDVVKEFVTKKTDKFDFVLIETGGTVGDIEGLPFYEAIRQLGFELGKENTCFIHLTYLPYIKTAGELKTKPTQHSVKALQSLGIQPDIILCRADVDIQEKELKKISLFCNVEEKNVIPAPNVNNIYEAPLVYHKNGLDECIIRHFKLENKKNIDIEVWEKINDTVGNFSKKVDIAIVGKYTSSKESYKSIVEALDHAGIANNVKVNVVWVEARDIKSDKDLDILKNVKGILVPGGFGKDGTEGKILSVKYAREHNIPFLGICFGMQMAVVEFARNVLDIKDASSSEFSDTPNPVICLITEWDKNGFKEKRDKNSDLGGTMRLGGYDMRTKKGSLLRKIYEKEVVRERHRHRYEINIRYLQKFEERGLKFSMTSMDGLLPEAIELENHRFFVGVQYHPEMTSRPFAANPLFKSFVERCIAEI